VLLHHLSWQPDPPQQSAASFALQGLPVEMRSPCRSSLAAAALPLLTVLQGQQPLLHWLQGCYLMAVSDLVHYRMPQKQLQILAKPSALQKMPLTPLALL